MSSTSETAYDFKNMTLQEIEDEMDSNQSNFSDYIESEEFRKISSSKPYYYFLNKYHNSFGKTGISKPCQNIINFVKTIHRYITTDEIEDILNFQNEALFKILLNCSGNDWCDTILFVMLKMDELNEQFFDIYFTAYDILDEKILKIVCSNQNFEKIWPFFDKIIICIGDEERSIIDEYAISEFHFKLDSY